MALIFRKPIVQIFDRLSELSFGGAKASFDRKLGQTAESLGGKVSFSAAASKITTEQVELAESSPRAAILEGWLVLEALLKQLVSKNQEATNLSGSLLLRAARRAEVVNDDLYRSLNGVLQLRNLAAHAPADEIGLERAKEFLVLAEVNENLLRNANDYWIEEEP